ncbi:MAG: PH domain-containing protein [Eggerthellaceae bacterium]|jgi:membrane protein YdbS with pleckstrin-like domain
MKDLPANQLCPRVKNLWRLNDFIWLTVVFAMLILLAFIFSASLGLSIFFVLFVASIYLLCLVIWLIILPPIRYIRWRYEINDDFLDIACGIIWRKRYVIPFIRVQNTDTRQGPLQRAFNLESVTVSTAAGQHEIPGLDIETAEQLRDHAAELARIAREDV